MIWPYTSGNPVRRDRTLLHGWLPPDSWRLEQHEVDLPVPPAAALEAGFAVTLGEVPYVRSLFKLRGLPTVEGGTVGHFFGTPPFLVLEDDPGRERVVGVVGPFWQFGAGRAPADLPETPAQFRQATAAGRMAALANFRADPREGGCRLSTETWVSAPRTLDAAAFTAYWLTIGPFSAWIRRLVLQAARERVAKAP
jgi:hypothetical protein